MMTVVLGYTDGFGHTDLVILAEGDERSFYYQPADRPEGG